MTQTTDIWNLVEPYLADERLELDDIELVGRGRGRILRVLVDGEDLGVDRLAELSRGLSRLLDDVPGLQDQYQLEVSSPGLERKLRLPSHFEKSVGREVKVKARALDANTAFQGVLAEAGPEKFTVASDDGRVEVLYEDVVSAKTVFRWEMAQKPGH